MNIGRIFKLVTMLVDKRTTYPELAEFIFGEKPPEGHNFFSRLGKDSIVEVVKSESYDKVCPFLENPHTAARVAFIIRYPFQYFIFKDIYTNLPESEFVIDWPFIKSEMQDGYKTLKILSEFLQNKGVHYRIFEESKTGAEVFFNPYDTLVSYFWIGILDFPCNSSKKKVRVMYGHGKDLYNFGAWSRHFDLALTYGPYSERMISTWTRAEAVGNPRFDDWFSGKIDENTVAPLRKRLDPKKKTVLYMPTHHTLSSLEFITPVIGKLWGEFNLIIKPHPSTLSMEKERLQDFKEKLESRAAARHIFWADDLVDNTHLLYVSDAVISDNSGAIFDAVLADKPLVLIDVLPEGFLEKGNWELKKIARNSWLLPGLYAESVDQRTKKEPDLRPGEVVKKPEDLYQAVKLAILDSEEYQRARRGLRDMLFSHCDGSSGKRAANLIRNLVYEPPRTETFLELALRAEDVTQSAIYKDRLSDLSKVSANYFSLTPYWESFAGENEIIFSVVVPTYNGCNRIVKTLDSIINQVGFNPERFEVIVIDDGSVDDTLRTVRKFIQKNKEYKLAYLRLRENRGPSYARNIGILHARGTYVAFTDDDCIVPEDWLATFHLEFRGSPEIAGVGGWYQTHENENENLFNRFTYWENLPAILQRRKSSEIYYNQCGNTANVCYRKSVLEKIGGFNHFFIHPSLDDWELKIRIHRHLFSLLSYDKMVRHQSTVDLPTFIRRTAVRGWARFLTYKIHHVTPLYYNIGLINTFFLVLHGWRKILYNADGEIFLPFRDKVVFFFVNTLYQLATWFGKYWIPLEILAKKSSRQKIS